VIKIKNKIIIILLLISAFLVGCGENAQLKNLEKQVLQKLSVQYKEDFEIESSEYIRENDSYIFFVHPKSDPEFSFRVTKWKATGNDINTGDYIKSKRFWETTKLLKPYADKIDKRNLFNAMIGSSGTEDPWLIDMDVYWDTKHSVMDIIKKYPKKVRISVSMFYFFDLNDANTERVCKEIYELVKYLQSLGVHSVDLEVLFYDEKYFQDKDINKLLDECGESGMMNFDSTYGINTLSMFNIGNTNGIEHYETIKNYKEIEKKIRYRKNLGKNEQGDENYEWINK